MVHGIRELRDYGFFIVTIVAIGTIGRDRGSGENTAEMHVYLMRECENALIC